MSGRQGKEEMTYDSLLWEETRQQRVCVKCGAVQACTVVVGSEWADS